MPDAVHIVPVFIIAGVGALDVRQFILQSGFQGGVIGFCLNDVGIFRSVGSAQHGAHGSIHHHRAGRKGRKHHNNQHGNRTSHHQPAFMLLHRSRHGLTDTAKHILCFLDKCRTRFLSLLCFPKLFGILALDALFLNKTLDGIFLQFRVIPDSGTISGTDIRPVDLGFQLLHTLIRGVLPVLADFMAGESSGPLRRKLCPMGGFRTHVFFLHLMNLGVDGGTGTLYHAPARLFRQGFLPTFFLHFLKPECVLQPAFFGIKFFLQTQFFLLRHFLFRLFQLRTQNLRLVFRTGSPFLRGEIQPFAALYIVSIVDVGFFLHGRPPYAAKSAGFVVITWYSFVSVGNLSTKGIILSPKNKSPSPASLFVM